MGLDVVYYTNIEFIREAYPDSKKEESKRKEEGWDEDAWIKNIPVFPSFFDIEELSDCELFRKRADGLNEGIYKADKRGEFRVGSYGYHHKFRVAICSKIMGYRWKRDEDGFDLPLFLKEKQPFEAFINMSDCEGYIGPYTSVRLFNDFVKYQSKAREKLTEEEYETYMDWLNAFKAVKNNGVIILC